MYRYFTREAFPDGRFGFLDLLLGVVQIAFGGFSQILPRISPVPSSVSARVVRMLSSLTRRAAPPPEASTTTSFRDQSYAVTRLDYTPPSNDETGRVFIELKANAKGAIASTTLRISAGDIVGKTVGEIFAAKGF